MSRNITSKNQKMPLLSKESAKIQYDRLFNAYHTDTGGLPTKVVTFQHNMEKGILDEITRIKNFKDIYDPRDKNVKPRSAKRIIEKGQLSWLYSNIEKTDFSTDKVISGFIPDVLIDDIDNLKKWRNTGEHKDIMPWDKFLTHLGTMARTIELFSGMPIPKEINDILNNKSPSNSSNNANKKEAESKEIAADVGKKEKVTEKTSVKPEKKKPEIKTEFIPDTKPIQETVSIKHEKEKIQDKYTYVISSNGIKLFHCTYNEVKEKILKGEIERNHNICEVGSTIPAPGPEIGTVSGFIRFFEEREKEQKRIEEEKIAEQKRLEEKKIAEQKRLEEQKIAEQKRLEEQKIFEQKRLEQKKRKKRRKLIVPLFIAGFFLMLFAAVDGALWLVILFFLAMVVGLYFLIFK
jgi:hypothetical protein